VDLTDEQWEVLASLIPEPPRRTDGRGRSWRDPRDVLNGILWAFLRTGGTSGSMLSRSVAFEQALRHAA
jgi:transposase